MLTQALKLIMLACVTSIKIIFIFLFFFSPFVNRQILIFCFFITYLGVLLFNVTLMIIRDTCPSVSSPKPIKNNRFLPQHACAHDSNSLCVLVTSVHVIGIEKKKIFQSNKNVCLPQHLLPINRFSPNC